MTRSTTFIAVCAVSMSAANVFAALITVPTDLNPGDQYRLAFVTSSSTGGLSTNISDYNAFVTAVAAGVPELVALGTTWKAVGSTASVNARDNTVTNPLVSTGVPVYTLVDARIANDNADLWDGSLHSPLKYNEHGAELERETWTGTSDSGVGFPGGQLGTNSPVIGSTSSIVGLWISWVQADPSEPNGLYAISGVLTVVPEPTTSTLALAVLCLAMSRRRAF